VKDVWSIIRKLTTRKYVGNSLSKEPTLRETKPHQISVGHNALAWSSGDKRRTVMGSMHPCSDWRPPNTLWHRNLNLRFEEWRKRWPGGVVPKLPSDCSERYK
jgi:hypothetical protein